MDDASSDDLGSDDLGSDDLGSDETLYFECEEPSSEDDALFFEDDKISPHFFCLK